jgi:hypothetical protein
MLNRKREEEIKCLFILSRGFAFECRHEAVAGFNWEKNTLKKKEGVRARAIMHVLKKYTHENDKCWKEQQSHVSFFLNLSTAHTSLNMLFIYT